MSSIHPYQLGVGSLAPSSQGVEAARAGQRSTDSAAAWLDAGADATSEALHVSPHDARRSIDDIERDFIAALCDSADGSR
ncbi:hypothetical protein [Piscinibacter terrae]|uniref:Uncharacterized protein n=1 Tax=Piscinibacter terrae TaxID=2496871 RepID=A0A3N7JIK9_9BURK|nr:hypothetical protein [Albitalea terrae]RQP21279.1 hypothetical protein DZC73_29010 [Albitalea terrae]